MYSSVKYQQHDDVIKWKHFPRNWPFVRGIHRSPVNSSHKGQPRGALVFSLICVWIKGWINNREAGDLRRYRAHYDVIVMRCCSKGVDEGTRVKLERSRIRATRIIEVIRLNEMNPSAIDFIKTLFCNEIDMRNILSHLILHQFNAKTRFNRMVPFYYHINLYYLSNIWSHESLFSTMAIS